MRPFTGLWDDKTVDWQHFGHASRWKYGFILFLKNLQQKSVCL
jgi:hypothetical protein